MRIYNVFRQLGAVVHIGIGICAVGAFGSQAVGVVGVVPAESALLHIGKLPAVFPPVSPYAVAGEVTGVIIGEPGAVTVGTDQIKPDLGVIGIGYGFGRRYARQAAGCIAILRPAGYVAALVVCPGVGIAHRLIIFPDKLIGRIVFVADGVVSVADGQNIAVIIIGIGISVITADSAGSAVFRCPRRRLGEKGDGNAAPFSPYKTG